VKVLVAPSFKVSDEPPDVGASLTFELVITTKVDLLSSSLAFTNLYVKTSFLFSDPS